MMREIFNPAAVRCTLSMFAVLAVLLAALHFTSNTEALAACQATHSADVCEFTLK
jgi:hypothetical protein